MNTVKMCWSVWLSAFTCLLSLAAIFFESACIAAPSSSSLSPKEGGNSLHTRLFPKHVYSDGGSGEACSRQSVDGSPGAFQLRQDQVLVELPGFGPIVGNRETSVEGNTYHSFKGIQYSKAGRFEDYVAPEPWQEPFQATEFGPNCMMPADSPDSDENCLYVNVYTSNLDASTGPAPVFALVHGGSFLWGDGRLNPVYFMDTPMVAVVFNYRLGPLGFLHSPDPAANFTGNYGLKDQIQALRWIQNTVSAFGGDPNDVTLFGMSAGAASVHFLMLAKQETEGLFHKAITMSGSALCPFAKQKNPGDNVVKFAKAVGCLDESAQEPGAAAYQCIRALDAVTLSTSWQSEFAVWAGQPFVFVPSVDGNLIRDDPLNLLASGDFLQIPWLGSNDKDEGSLILDNSLASLESMAYLRDNWQAMCPFILEMGNLSPSEATEACRLAKEHYMGGQEISHNSIYGLLKMAGDRLFDVPLQVSSQYHAQFAPFYGYRNDYQSPTRSYYLTLYENAPEDIPWLSSLVVHTDEFVQLILDDRPPVTAGDPDEFVHKLLLGAYVNFIKTGMPAIAEDVDYDIAWPEFTAELPQIQVVDSKPRVDNYWAEPRNVDFWTSLGLL